MLSPHYMHYAIPIGTTDLERWQKYASKLLGRVQYNYMDAIGVMPMLPAQSGDIVKTMIPDIDSTNPDRVEKLFCSQVTGRCTVHYPIRAYPFPRKFLSKG